MGIFILTNIYNKRIMKLIINERQLKIIEAFITENKYDKDTMIDIGNMLKQFIDIVNAGKDIKLTTKNNNELILKLISDNNSTFVFNVLKDDVKLAKKFTQLQIYINQGNGDLDGDEESIDIYLKNKNIAFSDGISINLLFNGSNKTLKNKSIKINNIVNIKSYDEVENDSTDDSNSGDTSTTGTTTGTTTGSTEGILDDAKIAYDMISKDPLLKKAFYSQPSFLNLFVAELTGKRAVGKGIYSVLNLVRKYNNKKYTDYLKAEFIEGKEITFMFLDSIESNEIINFKVDKQQKIEYKSEVNIELNYYPILVSENNGITLELEIKDPIKGNIDAFSCILVIKNGKKTYKEPNRKSIKIIRGERSPGYKPIANTTSNTTSGTTTTNTTTSTN